MNDNPRSSDGNGAIAVIFLIVLILLGLVGLGAGFFFVGRSTATVMQAPTAQKAATLAATPFTPATSFDLSSLDIKDTLEAPAIAVTASGHVLVAYASQVSDDQRALFLTRSTDAGRTFPPPQQFRQTKIYHSVSQTNGKEVKRAVRLLPQLASGGGKVFLGWLEPNADNTNIYYYVAESTDEGVTFGEPMRVHESEGARPNFISLAADEHGNVAASWLDTRAGIKQPFAAVKLAGEAAFQPETQVYSSPNESGVCPCCSTAVVISPDGEVIVAFRNQLDGYRDIYVASRKLAADSEFGPAVPVVEKPTWKFDGCPHDGPALAIHNSQLYVAWMDASLGQPTCFRSSSPLAKLQFAPATRLASSAADPQGNAKLVSSEAGISVVWEKSIADGSSTEPANPAGAHDHGAAPGSARAIYFESPMQPSRIVAPPSPGVYQSRPAIAYVSGVVILAFNQLDDQGKRVVIQAMAP